MKKITQQAVKAFLNGKSRKIGNTEVEAQAGGVTRLLLFGNLIALRQRGELYIQTAGWPSNTTKERLNALPGVSIGQYKGVWYLNGNPWGGELVRVGGRTGA